MSLGRINVNSLDDYQANLAQIEKARQVLNFYEAMNEEAKNKLYEQELAQRVAEGERARQELELLKRRNALAITAPTTPPSLPTVATPVQIQTTARIEEVPTPSGHAEQRHVHPSNVRPRFQTDQWRVQRQEPSQRHTHYTNVRMPQYTEDQTQQYQHYYSKPVTQRNENQSAYPTNQTPSQYQNVPVWSASPSVRQAPQQFQQQQLPIQASTPNTRQTQQITAPHSYHPQQGTFPPKSNSPSNTQLNSAITEPPVFANSSSLIGALEPVSSSTSERQKDLVKSSEPTQSGANTMAPYQPFVPRSDVHFHQFKNPIDFFRYMYTIGASDMPPNSYYQIPSANAQYTVFKTADNLLLLAYYDSDAKKWGYCDIRRLIQNDQGSSAAPPPRKQENTQPQTISVSTPLQTQNLQTAQVSTTTPAQLPSKGGNAQPSAVHQIISIPPLKTVNLQATQVSGTPIPSTVNSSLHMGPQQRPEIDVRPQQSHAHVSPKRTPADADKKTLARDILRNLRIKRPLPADSLTSRTVQRPAKRREQQPVGSSIPLPAGTPGTVHSGLGDPSPMSTRPPTLPLSAPLTSTRVSLLRSPSTDLPPVRIAELPTEPEPKQSLDVVPGIVEEASSPTAAGPTLIDVVETTDDAADSLNRLSIQEQTATPTVGGDQSPRAQIGETKEGEIQVPHEIEEIEEGEIQVVEETKEGKTQAIEEIEEGELQEPREGEKEEQEEEKGDIKLTQASEVGERVLSPVAKLANKMPLFLPSPSPSPQGVTSHEESRQSSAHPPPDSSILDEDISVHEGTPPKRQPLKSRYGRPPGKEFYILVPSPPPYVRKFKEQETRQKTRRKPLIPQGYEGGGQVKQQRSPSEDDTSDPLIQLTIKNSTTRIAEKRCKWSGCDAILNSSQNLFEHLKRNHSMPDLSKPYILCNWSGCGDHVRNEAIENHFASHSFPSFLCPYTDCDESFRSVQALVRHNEAKHISNEMKRAPEPFSPSVQEPPPIPYKVPDYLIKSGLVRQEPIPRTRHAVLGPWVYNNIAGPVKVTKRYNAAKDKPTEYGFLQSSSMQFSTNPSQPANIRDMGDLPSGEVSEMISDGVILWPPQEEERINVDGLGAVTIGVKSPSVAHQSSEEYAVETMLTGQLSGS